jgi:hypothetical protein
MKVTTASGSGALAEAFCQTAKTDSAAANNVINFRPKLPTGPKGLDAARS